MYKIINLFEKKINIFKCLIYGITLIYKKKSSIFCRYLLAFLVCIGRVNPRLISISWQGRRRERHASSHETGERAVFRWSNSSAGSHRKYGTKGYLFWVIDVAKYYTNRHCVRTRVLDISIALMEPVPGHIVDERVYIGTALGRILLIVWVVLPPRTDVPLPPGLLPRGQKVT